MQFFISIIYQVEKQIFQSKVTSVFLMIGLTVSVLLISVGISFSYESIYAGQQKEKKTPPNGRVYVVSGESEKTLTTENIEHLFSGIRKQTGVFFNGLMAHPHHAKINTYFPVTAEWFQRDDGWHYPLVKGRYYSAKEIKNESKVALIGKSLEGCLRKGKDQKQYLEIDHVQYEVIGIIGLQGQISLWDNRICIPATVLPESIVNDLTFSDSSISMVLYHPDGEMEKDIKTIHKNGRDIDSDFEIEDTGRLQTENILNNLVQSQDAIYTLAVMGYIITIIYAANITVFWIEKRRYEIGLRKALGYTNLRIAVMLYSEMFGIACVSAAVALLLQFLLCVFVERISKYTLQLYSSNIISALLVVAVTAFFTSLVPVIKALKISPTGILKEGETE